MTAQRSLTDEQLAARWDKEPFERNGERADMEHAVPDYEPGVFGKIIESSRWTYDPRPECIPSRDPLPLVGVTSMGDVMRAPTGSRRGGSGKPLEFMPRPEFARPPVNPILVVFRDEQRAYSVVGDEEGQFRDFMFWMQHPTVWEFKPTPDQIDFARKVLTRLASLQAVTS